MVIPLETWPMQKFRHFDEGSVNFASFPCEEDARVCKILKETAYIMTDND